MHNILLSIDNSILVFIKNNLHNNVLDNINVFITTLGNSGMIWIIISLSLISLKKYRKIGVMVIVALCISTLVGDVLIKFLVQRQRPSTFVAASELLIDKPLSYSFPSGHSMSSFACAGILASSFRKYAVAFMSLATFIAFSRVYLFVHYPSDVLAGMVFGLIVSYCEILLVRRYFHGISNKV